MLFQSKRGFWKSVVFLFVLLSLGACNNPAYWEAVAEEMSSANTNTYGSNSGQRQEVCAKYQTRSGWSQGYIVTATVIDGSDLNTETGSYNYDPSATYAVIFWDQGEASVLKLQSYSEGITAYGTSATDRQGRSWQVSESSVCY